MGDVMLKAVAKQIDNISRKEQDHKFRWGGEEFVLLLENTAKEGVEALAERLRSTIENTIKRPDETFQTLTLSAITIIPDNNVEQKLTEQTITQLQTLIFDIANLALFEGKEHGKNQVVPASYSLSTLMDPLFQADIERKKEEHQIAAKLKATAAELK
jgi:diguanylate cyclase (GGDEF)-like protein